jgi:hypothetical protein
MPRVRVDQYHELVPKREVLQLECGLRFEGRRSGGGQQVKCAERQTEGMREDTQSHVLMVFDIYDRDNRILNRKKIAFR